jgi:hypothetical protein
MKRLIKLVLVVAATVIIFRTQDCGSFMSSDTTAVDTLTRRQKDSLVAEMPIPGSRGVRRAIDATDAANARTQAFDSIP